MALIVVIDRDTREKWAAIVRMAFEGCLCGTIFLLLLFEFNAIFRFSLIEVSKHYFSSGYQKIQSRGAQHRWKKYK